MISRNVYGGQLNINIKNNQSIWAIFNEEDQNILNNIPIDIYSTDQPLSESRYIPTTDNFVGITPEPHNELTSFFDKTQSTPIIPNNEYKITNSTVSTDMSTGLNIPQAQPKNVSEGPMQYPQQTQNQNNQNMLNNMNPQQNRNNINDGLQVPQKQKNQSQIYTFGNEIFSYINQEPFGNKQILEQQQNQMNNLYMQKNYNNNAFNNIQSFQSPTTKNNPPPKMNRFFPEQGMNYPVNNNVNNNINNNQNTIVRGKIVNRAPYPQNIGINRPIPNNQIPNQQGYPNPQMQIVPKNPVQNPGINQIVNRPNVNLNHKQIVQPQYAPRPGQSKFMVRQNLSPSPKIIQQNKYTKETAPRVNQILYNQKKNLVINNNPPRTPTKVSNNFNGVGAINRGKNIIKDVRPKMFRENPANRDIMRMNSFQNLNIKNNQVKIGSSKKVPVQAQSNIKNNKIVGYIIQRPIARNLANEMTPQKLQIAQNIGGVRPQGHFVYTQNNVL